MEDKKINLLTIPPDKSISIEISGYFYQRLNKLMLEYAEINGTDTFIKAMYVIKQGKSSKNDYAFNIETLIMLMKEIEEEFDKQGHTSTQEIDVKDIDLNQNDDSDKTKS